MMASQNARELAVKLNTLCASAYWKDSKNNTVVHSSNSSNTHKHTQSQINSVTVPTYYHLNSAVAPAAERSP